MFGWKILILVISTVDVWLFKKKKTWRVIVAQVRDKVEIQTIYGVNEEYLFITTSMFCLWTEIWIHLIFRLDHSSLRPQNVHASSLNINNQIYSPDCDNQYRHYESILVKANTTGHYSFLSESTIDIYGLIYANTFNPLNPSENLLDTDDDSALDLQMKLGIRLSAEMTYVLVVTTSRYKQIGLFSIVVSGDDKVTLKRQSKCRHALIGCFSPLYSCKRHWTGIIRFRRTSSQWICSSVVLVSSSNNR